jgi:hypothetical protein
MSALEVAKRVYFLLAAARHARAVAPTAPVIEATSARPVMEGQVVRKSEDGRPAHSLMRLASCRPQVAAAASK